MREWGTLYPPIYAPVEGFCRVPHAPHSLLNVRGKRAPCLFPRLLLGLDLVFAHSRERLASGVLCAGRQDHAPEAKSEVVAP